MDGSAHGFAQVDDEGKPAHFPEQRARVEVPSGEAWERLDSRLKKLLRLR